MPDGAPDMHPKGEVHEIQAIQPPLETVTGCVTADRIRVGGGATPPVSSADSPVGQRVETFVLPAGTPTPTLEELKSGKGLQRLQRAAA